MTISSKTNYFWLKTNINSALIESIKQRYNHFYGNSKYDLNILKNKDDEGVMICISCDNINNFKEIIEVLDIIFLILTAILITLNGEYDTYEQLEFIYDYNFPYLENTKNNYAILLNYFNTSLDEDERVMYDDEIMDRINCTTNNFKNRLINNELMTVEEISYNLVGIKIINANIDDIFDSCFEVILVIPVTTVNIGVTVLSMDDYETKKLNIRYNLNAKILN